MAKSEQLGRDFARALERYALLATGLIWSACATNYALPPVRILIWVPALITFLFGIRAWG